MIVLPVMYGDQSICILLHDQPQDDSMQNVFIVASLL